MQSETALSRKVADGNCRFRFSGSTIHRNQSALSQALLPTLRNHDHSADRKDR